MPAIVVVERLVHRQLNSYFNERDICSHTQHGYGTNFITETALTEVIENIPAAMDVDIVLLVRIDRYKCFDVGHQLLVF